MNAEMKHLQKAVNIKQSVLIQLQILIHTLMEETLLPSQELILIIPLASLRCSMCKQIAAL